MSKYFIPDSVREGFESLVALSAAHLNLIIKKMDEFNIGDGPTDFYELLSPLNVPNIDEISKTIFSFCSLLIDNNDNPRSLAEGLVDAFLAESDVKAKTKNKEKIIERLLNIFESSRKLKTSYKLYALSGEVQNAYRDSLIITDIRVAFNDSLEEGDRNAIITHQLKLEFSKNSKRAELFINLERADLEELKTQIDRALEKENILTKDYGNVFKFIQIKP